MNEPISHEKWALANKILISYGSLIEPYTIVLATGITESGNDGYPIGTAVLIEYKSQKIILTAAHVSRALQENIILIHSFEKERHTYPTYLKSQVTIKEWDDSLNENDLKSVLLHRPKDLAIIYPSNEMISAFEKNDKNFYKISNFDLMVDDKFALVSIGALNSHKNSNDWDIEKGPYGFVPSQTAYDMYVRCNIHTETFGTKNCGETPVKNISGLSGGGLWFIDNITPCLVGITIAQNFSNDDIGYSYFHSLKAIKSFFEIIQ